jgi:hypothetical protein
MKAPDTALLADAFCLLLFVRRSVKWLTSEQARSLGTYLSQAAASTMSAVRLPNTRVQRPRSSPSAHHSPLTRYPFGRPMFESGA